MEKYNNGTCTPKEKTAIDQWYEKYHDAPGFTDSLPKEKFEALESKMFGNIMGGITLPNEAVDPTSSKEPPGNTRSMYRKTCRDRPI